MQYPTPPGTVHPRSGHTLPKRLTYDVVTDFNSPAGTVASFVYGWIGSRNYGYVKGEVATFIEKSDARSAAVALAQTIPGADVYLDEGPFGRELSYSGKYDVK